MLLHTCITKYEVTTFLDTFTLQLSPWTTNYSLYESPRDLNEILDCLLSINQCLISCARNISLSSNLTVQPDNINNYNVYL